MIKSILLPEHCFWDDDEIMKYDCMLRDVMEQQKSFMISLKIPLYIKLSDKFTKTTSPSHRDVTRTLQEFLACISSECEEIREWTHWKSWKKYKDPIDLDEIRLEFIDILHFVLEAMIYLGMKPEDVYRYYVSKMRENQDRQKRGYSG